MYKLRLKDVVNVSQSLSRQSTPSALIPSIGYPCGLLPKRGLKASKSIPSSPIKSLKLNKQIIVDGRSSSARSIPLIINNLPSQKPLHHSSDFSEKNRVDVPYQPLSGISGSLRLESLPTKDLQNHLRKSYDDALHFCRSKKLPDDVDPSAVFACNRLDLRKIEIYGFDYDYTLAHYKPELEELIYNLGREALLTKYKYPDAIKDLPYNQNFAVRGLHYDIKRGLLLKVDSFMQIQLGCVYRGLTILEDEEVLEIYGGRKLPANYIEVPNQYHDPKSMKMVQLADLFSVPEMNLLCNVIEYLYQNNIDYHPQSLFWDVKEAVGSIHPLMHQIVQKDPQSYLQFDPLLREYLLKLKESDKKIFLVTNSPYQFVDKGLCHIVGEDWLDIFDVTVVNARKPHFFSNDSIPFRKFDPQVDARLWDRVYSLDKGSVYYGGTLKQFQKLTGWQGDKVVYFGDHAYTDLADVTLHHGWRTGAIIKELEHEIETLNSADFKSAMNWMQFLTSLLETYQDLDNPEVQEVIKEWQEERNSIRRKTKQIFNHQFGSLFRTHLNPTFFSKRLFRFADIYTSSVTNLMKYSLRHTFYPRRGALPHEYRSWFN